MKYIKYLNLVLTTALVAYMTSLGNWAATAVACVLTLSEFQILCMQRVIDTQNDVIRLMPVKVVATLRILKGGTK